MMEHRTSEPWLQTSCSHASTEPDTVHKITLPNHQLSTILTKTILQKLGCILTEETNYPWVMTKGQVPEIKLMMMTTNQALTHWQQYLLKPKFLPYINTDLLNRHTGLPLQCSTCQHLKYNNAHIVHLFTPTTQFSLSSALLTKYQ